MRYFKIIYFTNGDEYNTHETILTEPKYREFQKMLGAGADQFIFTDQTIRRSQIKESGPADDIMKEYIAQGLTHKELGLPEPITFENKEEPKKLGEGFKQLYG